MKFFLDSAKMDEITMAYDTFGIDGVTTNPRHIQSSGMSFLRVIHEMADWVQEKKLAGHKAFPISVEINPYIETKEEMIADAKKLAAISPNFVIKIPCTDDGITAARYLEAEGIRTNITLVFTVTQALIAAKNGAKFVSPFIGWKEANGEDCGAYIRDIMRIYDNYGFESEVICAAVRTGRQIAECAVSGANIVTAGLAVYLDSFRSPYTGNGMALFRNAWNQTVKE